MAKTLPVRLRNRLTHFGRLWRALIWQARRTTRLGATTIHYKSKFAGGLLASATITLAFALYGADRAAADTLINTIGSDTYTPGAGFYVADVPGSQVQSIALPFSVGGDSFVTGVEAYLNAGGGLTLGLMTDSSGVPSGTFISGDSVHITSGAPIDLTSLDWSVTPGSTDWLVAIADPSSLALWQFSSAPPALFAFTGGNVDTTWIQNTIQPLPEAIVTGAVSVPGETPIPAALPLFATGLAGLGLLGWRRKRKGQAVA